MVPAGLAWMPLATTGLAAFLLPTTPAAGSSKLPLKILPKAHFCDLDVLMRVKKSRLQQNAQHPP
jgi:hypothetical protein